MDFVLKTAEQLRQQIRALRKRTGMTQAQLGAALGVSQARVVEIEAMPGSVSLQQIMQVLHVLGAGLIVRADDLTPAEEQAQTNARAVRASVAQGVKRGSW
ncbi:MAG: transcriptional regulator [Proteobacteria bacterium]|nr:MAG: transcriptional regulator [Pseudomonadota bacterium]